MKEVVVISGKGGSGKTSLSSSLVCLAGNCTLCDCDVETPNLQILMNSSITKAEPFFGLPRAFIDPDLCIQCGLCMDNCHFSSIQNYSVEASSCEGCQFCKLLCPVGAVQMKEYRCGQMVSSQTDYGVMFHARLSPGEQNSGKLVASLRQKARQHAAETGQQLIITDGPPGVGCPVIASLTGCSLAVIVAEPGLASIHDMKRAEALCRHFRIEYGMVINKADINTEKTRELQQYCHDNGIPLFGVLAYHKSFRDAINHCSPPAAYSIELEEMLLPVWHNIQEKLFPSGDSLKQR